MKLSHRLARVAPALVATALLLAPELLARRAFAQDDEDEAPKVETKFTRFRDTKRGGKLEVAYATYKKEGSDVEVVLYGAVHIADKAYYKKVQQDLDACDVVLFEGVGPSKKETEPDENMKTITELQTSMGKFLGLSFQKDGINYTRKNLVHADMTYEELLKATDGDISKALPGAGMLSDPSMKKQLKAALDMMKGGGMMDSFPGMKDQIKLMMARQLAGADISKQGGEGAEKILIGARNQVCLKVLDQQLEKTKSGKIAIFYGAAHMKDFHNQLGKKGWTQDKVVWNTAWDIGGKKKKAETEDEPAPTPAMPQREAPADKPKARWF